MAITLDHSRDWILAGALKGCSAGVNQRYLRKESWVDFFPRFYDKFALRLANRKIWFKTAHVGEISTPVGSTDHWGQSLVTTVRGGDHALRVEYIRSRSRCRLFWDSKLIGDWTLQFSSVPGTMTSLDVSNVTGGALRTFHGSYTSLGD